MAGIILCWRLVVLECVTTYEIVRIQFSFHGGTNVGIDTPLPAAYVHLNPAALQQQSVVLTNPKEYFTTGLFVLESDYVSARKQQQISYVITSVKAVGVFKTQLRQL